MENTLRETDRPAPGLTRSVTARGDRLRRDQLARLLRIVFALRGDRCPNTRQLADECEVSRRTIFRDLETIEAAGIPIIYDAARQGYRLEATARVAPGPIDDEQAEPFLTLLCRWGGTDPGLLVGQARAGLVQFIRSGPRRSGMEAELAVAVDELPRSTRAGSSRRRAVFDGLLDAVSTRRRLALVVSGSVPEAIVASGFVPYRILLDRGGWGVVGHFTRDGLVRLIPFANIERASVTDELAEIPPRFSLDRWLELGQADGPGRAGRAVRLRVPAAVAALLPGSGTHPSREIESQPDARVELELTVDAPDELVGWILGHGGEVEVIEPLDLRRRVRAAALGVARRHRGRPSTERGREGHFTRVSG